MPAVADQPLMPAEKCAGANLSHPLRTDEGGDVVAPEAGAGRSSLLHPRPCHRLPLVIHDVELQPVVGSTGPLELLSYRIQSLVGGCNASVDVHDSRLTIAVPPPRLD